MKSEKLSNNIIESMFLSSAAVMIATQIIGVVAIIIDGVITGWKLGMEAYNISAETSWWLVPTYWVREWFGVTYYALKK